jgi:hypothetical protein
VCCQVCCERQHASLVVREDAQYSHTHRRERTLFAQQPVRLRDISALHVGSK